MNHSTLELDYGHFLRFNKGAQNQKGQAIYILRIQGIFIAIVN